MALKTMIFIDGSWLFHNKGEIMAAFNDPEFKINYQSIPEVIARHLEGHTNMAVDVARTCFFGSIPVNKPNFDPTAQQAFYDYLQKDCRFEVEIFEIDFKNQPNYSPQEKCVDIGVATSMMYYAAMPGAMDVAALVAGDYDYMPLLRRVRMMGKRTLLVALRKLGNVYPTSQRLLYSTDLFDFPPLFLEEHLDEIRLVKEKRIRQCDTCGTEELTDWSGRFFYCQTCRARHREETGRDAVWKDDDWEN